ncbi:hypothetical protein V8F33_011823 [Rhypophila sp. PSN 637]
MPPTAREVQRRTASVCLVLGLSCHYNATAHIPSTPAISRNQTLGSPRGLLAPSTVLPVDMVLASPRVLNDYMQYRNRVRATVPISPRAETIGLPAFMENPTGLRMALVLSIAHMRLREGSSTGIGQTSIIHKLGVLDDIKQLIATSSVDISDFVQTTIALLFQIEFAAGDRDAAEAHLRGMINLEATHSDTQAQQLRARIALCFYSLISRGIIIQNGHSSGAVARTRDPAHAAYRDAAFIYMHITHDYLVEPTRGELVWTRGTDTQLLRGGCLVMSEDKAVSASGTPKQEAMLWALTVARSPRLVPSHSHNRPNDHTTENRASLDLTRCQSPKRMPKLPARQREAKRPIEAKTTALQELSHWVDGLVDDWRRSPRMVEWHNSGQFADKIEWLGTDKGLTLLEAICRESEDDGGLRDGRK